MKICISIGHGKSAKGGYDSGALGGNDQEFKIAREIGKYIGGRSTRHNNGRFRHMTISEAKALYVNNNRIIKTHAQAFLQILFCNN